MTVVNFNNFKYIINKHSKLIISLYLFWFAAFISICLSSLGYIYTAGEIHTLAIIINGFPPILVQLIGLFLMWYSVKKINENQQSLNIRKDPYTLIHSLSLASFLGWYVLSHKVKLMYLYGKLMYILISSLIISITIISMLALVPFMDGYTKYQIKRLKYTLMDNNTLLTLYLAMFYLNRLQMAPIIELSISMVLFAYILYYIVTFYDYIESSYNVLSALIFVDTVFILSIMIDIARFFIY